MSPEGRHLYRLILLLALVTVAISEGARGDGMTWRDSFLLGALTLLVKWLLERSVRRQVNAEDPPIPLRRNK